MLLILYFTLFCLIFKFCRSSHPKSPLQAKGQDSLCIKMHSQVSVRGTACFPPTMPKFSFLRALVRIFFSGKVLQWATEPSYLTENPSFTVVLRVIWRKYVQPVMYFVFRQSKCRKDSYQCLYLHSHLILPVFLEALSLFNSWKLDI